MQQHKAQAAHRGRQADSAHRCRVKKRGGVTNAGGHAERLPLRKLPQHRQRSKGARDSASERSERAETKTDQAASEEQRTSATAHHIGDADRVRPGAKRSEAVRRAAEAARHIGPPGRGGGGDSARRRRGDARGASRGAGARRAEGTASAERGGACRRHTAGGERSAAERAGGSSTHTQAATENG